LRFARARCALGDSSERHSLARRGTARARGLLQARPRDLSEDRKASLPDDEKRWVEFRLADLLWRSAPEGDDPTPFDEASRALERLLHDDKGNEIRDRVWAEAQESLWRRFSMEEVCGRTMLPDSLQQPLDAQIELVLRMALCHDAIRFAADAYAAAA
jgi:hypothetical protein